MSRRVGISLEEKTQAIEEIEAAMKATNDVRLRERYQTILMILNGEKYSKIASYTGRSEATLHNYTKSYRKGGIESLRMNYSTGAKPKLTPEQEESLCNTLINKTPKDVGFPSEMNWTSPLIRKYIDQEFSVNYSDRGTRTLLARLNFSFTRPSYTLENASPEKQEAFKVDFEELKKN